MYVIHLGMCRELYRVLNHFCGLLVKRGSQDHPQNRPCAAPRAKRTPGYLVAGTVALPSPQVTSKHFRDQISCLGEQKGVRELATSTAED